MNERTERSEGREFTPGWSSVNERTERSEGREFTPGWSSMTERTERSEGRGFTPGWSSVNPTNGPASALADALAAEYAAIWAYGVIGVHLTEAARTAARAAEAAHRSRRDALLLQLAEGSGQVPADQAGYALPHPVTDQASALRLAVEIEERTAGHWRAALVHTTGADRNTALAALTDCALRATRWRRTAGVTPVTVPFPGRPA
ncbi:protein of unknown function [Micromonospora marina]|uniref:DUF4439 domain-containing protein n=2 Tax=Micromonospora marina TaxID=307120 RepID=A0A1C4WT86_9ACTN|nr:protein of unknown function [Micromonospora marina]